MLEKPAIDERRIADCLRDAYGLDAVALTFLPLGADRHTAVYRGVTHNAAVHFVKLRSAGFDETLVIAPRILFDQGVRQVIPPLWAHSGKLWAALDEFAVTVFPFVEGRTGYETALTDAQWADLGRALKGIHVAALPGHVLARLPRETFSPEGRERVRAFQAALDDARFDDPISDGLAALLRAHRDEVDALIGYAERLAGVVRARRLDSVPCHGDIHAGNVLVDPGGALHLVDWDTLVLAPKERDLMYPGGGLFGRWRTAADEAAHFYRGYGRVPIDSAALAYFRCERVVQDIAAYCEQILHTDAGDDRAEGLRQLMGQFGPGEVIEIALHTAAALNLL